MDDLINKKPTILWLKLLNTKLYKNYYINFIDSTDDKSVIYRYWNKNLFQLILGIDLIILNLYVKSEIYIKYMTLGQHTTIWLVFW